ncbi:hypothetical protein C8Q74DRAFT_1313396 [Fomes fomentarius]|nr:hypothetical protein C8Q74DRAFT_1313396 [Fomes fomentarius]
MGVLQSRHVTSSANDDGDPVQPVREVRALLSQLGLPAELVLEIMDLAEYYPAVYAQREGAVHLRSDSHTRQNHCSSLLYLISPPIPGGLEGENWRMRKVTWTVEGRDQGWGGQFLGTFREAYSWYEATIFRPLPHPSTTRTWTTSDVQARLREMNWSLVPNGGDFVWHIQSNRVRSREFERHIIEWKAGEVADTEDASVRGCGDGAGFLDALQPGDRVGLWMRAMYPGWENHVMEAGVRLMYDVR